MFGIHRNGPCYKWIVLFKGQFYKGIIGNDHSCHGHFPIKIPLNNSMVKIYGSYNMATLYPSLCYNEVCYKGSAPYM